MRRGLRSVSVALATALLVLLVAGACGGGSGDADELSVTGVIIDVQSQGLTDLDSFTLRTDDGRELVFGVAPDARPEPDEGFVPGHLRTHAAAAERVEVFYREENGELLALRLLHAGPPS